MSQRTATLWTFVITSVALFMTTLDNLVVTTALPVIRKDLDASLSGLEWTVNAYTADLRRAPDHRRGARRPLRAAAHVRASAWRSSRSARRRRRLLRPSRC
jgi:hypothetical protein